NFIGVKAQSTDCNTEDYPDLRSQLWFDVATRAQNGNLALGMLEPGVLLKMKTQAMAPIYKLDWQGRRAVEPKDVTKKRPDGHRSPDDMDGLNLAYFETGGGVKAEWAPDDEPMTELMRTFGRDASHEGSDDRWGR